MKYFNVKEITRKNLNKKNIISIGLLVILPILILKIINIKYVMFIIFCLLLGVLNYLNKQVGNVLFIDYSYFMFFSLAYHYSVALATLFASIPFIVNLDKFNINTVPKILIYLGVSYFISFVKPLIGLDLLFIVAFLILKVFDIISILILSGNIIDSITIFFIQLIDVLINYTFLLPLVKLIILLL